MKFIITYLLHTAQVGIFTSLFVYNPGKRLRNLFSSLMCYSSICTNPEFLYLITTSLFHVSGQNQIHGVQFSNVSNSEFTN